MNADLHQKVETSNRTAEKFVKLYYKYFDKRRHLMKRLYLETGVFVWNGNGANGKVNIQEFLNKLPCTEHQITTLQALPIVDDAVGGQETHVIQVGGKVEYTGQPTSPFNQSIIITADGDKWKIVSDVYRIQGAMAQQNMQN